MQSDPISDLNASRALAEVALSQHLFAGQLALFLGAGVSKDAKLPNWDDLVRSIVGAAGLSEGDVRSDRLKAIDDVIAAGALEPREIPPLIRKGLYSAYMLRGSEYTRQAFKAALPNAIVDLTAGSSRGRVSDVFTLNFDDLIEALLWDRGFRYQTVSDFPTLFDGRTDVRVHHLHGHIPLRAAAGAVEAGDIVLSYSQFRQRLAIGHPWHQLLESTILAKVLLFVGVSFDDIEMDTIFDRCYRLIEEQRPIGFAILAKPDSRLVRQLADVGIVTIAVDRFAQIPDVIRRVTRLAAAIS